MYPISILHWIMIFGFQNTLIIPSKNFDLVNVKTDGQKIQQIYDEVDRFLGLCPFKRKLKDKIHKSSSKIKIDPSHFITEENEAILEDYFSPFNELLSIISGFDIFNTCKKL